MRALLFPGQGSQHVGMAADLFRADEQFRDLVRLASAETGEDLEKICLRGPDKLLRRNSLLQPLLVAVSLGYWRRLRERGLRADAIVGHSLGEISALGASGVLTADESVIVAAKRGQLMEQEAGKGRGGMLAVTSIRRDGLMELIADVSTRLPVALASDNAPDQIVLLGELDVLIEAQSLLGGRKSTRCRLLNVEGPWHSPLMVRARDEFRRWMERVEFKPPQTVLILNASGEAETNPQQIKELVVDALIAPVQWRTCTADFGGDVSAADFRGRARPGVGRLWRAPTE